MGRLGVGAGLDVPAKLETAQIGAFQSGDQDVNAAFLNPAQGLFTTIGCSDAVAMLLQNACWDPALHAASFNNQNIHRPKPIGDAPAR